MFRHRALFPLGTRAEVGVFKQWTPPVGCRVDWKLTGIRAFGGDLTGIRVKRWGNLTGIRFPLIKARRRRKILRISERFRAVQKVLGDVSFSR